MDPFGANYYARTTMMLNFIYAKPSSPIEGLFQEKVENKGICSQ